MNAPPRHILFDLGETLMRSRGDWDAIHEQADRALTESLRQSRIHLEPQRFRTRLHEYYEQRDKDFQETTYHFVLRELLKELGHADITESVIRSALDAMYAVTQTNWEIEDDTVETLQGLKSANYHIGILSNAGDDKDVQQIIESFGIRPFFDFVLTSAACFYRKPHPRAFEIALAHWSITPPEAVMVGDSLEADISGAKRLNMTAIWITRRAKFKDKDMHRIKPDFSLRKLSELFPTLERISLPRI
ncbi:MAG: HAD family hydrolase [Anaerolineaceae bacterium]|jgi:2-haloalkanoic acid dehalogenase type II|nr:MAG: HAD family hydrolase [Anaerolineaceae bacterium]